MTAKVGDIIVTKKMGDIPCTMTAKVGDIL